MYHADSKHWVCIIIYAACHMSCCTFVWYKYLKHTRNSILRLPCWYMVDIDVTHTCPTLPSSFSMIHIVFNRDDGPLNKPICTRLLKNFSIFSGLIFWFLTSLSARTNNLQHVKVTRIKYFHFHFVYNFLKDMEISTRMINVLNNTSNPLKLIQLMP